MSLFRDAEDLKEVFSNVHTSADDVISFVKDAEELYVVEFLSEDFYQELVTELESNAYDLSEVTPESRIILEKLRTAAAYYGLYDALPFINVHISNAGAMAGQGEGKTGLRQWEYKEALKNAIIKADNFLDKAMSILENNAGDYLTWSESSAFTIRKSLLLPDVKAFQDQGLVFLNDSRRTFIKLSSFQKKAVNRYIVSYLGEEFFTALQAKIVSETALSTEESKLMDDYVYPAIAHYTLYDAAPQMKLSIDGNGIYLASTNDGINSLQQDEKSYDHWRRHVQGDAQRYLSLAKKYLEDNAADFPNYTSDKDTENATQIYEIPSNDHSSSSLMF